MEQILIVAPNGSSLVLLRSLQRHLASGEGFLLGLHGDLGIEIGRIQLGVPQPSSDDVDFDTGFEEVDSRGVPKDVWRDRALAGRPTSQVLCVPANDLVDTETREPCALSG